MTKLCYNSLENLKRAVTRQIKKSYGSIFISLINHVSESYGGSLYYGIASIEGAEFSIYSNPTAILGNESVTLRAFIYHAGRSHLVLLHRELLVWVLVVYLKGDRSPLKHVEEPSSIIFDLSTLS